MKNKLIFVIICLLILSIFISAFPNTTEINILATTDLHGNIPYELVSYVNDQRTKDKNITLIDAGDFFDSGVAIRSSMENYWNERLKKSSNKIGEYAEVPLAKDMREVGYDAVVLGNHEFVANNKFHLDNMIYDFENQGINVLSANTYKKNGENYIKPYILKDIKTNEGTVKLGILGLTIKEVGERKELDDKGNLVDAKSLELKDQRGYDGELYMNDLVEDAKKWVDIMKKNKADIIIAVVHSGEKPKKPRNPGNRIQELAQEVNGIEAIVAGHTHIRIKQHDYQNKLKEKVIVTQPGKHGECISKINFKLKRNNNRWDIIDKSSTLITFEKNEESDKYGEFMFSLMDLDTTETQYFNLGKIIPFEWDKAYIFEPYTPTETIYKTVGYKWRNLAETDNNGAIQIVIMKDGKPICFIYGKTDQIRLDLKIDKSKFKDNVLTIYPNDNDKFKIQNNKDDFIVNLEYM